MPDSDLGSLTTRLVSLMERLEAKLDLLEKHVPLKRRAELIGVHPSTLRRWNRKNELRRKLETRE